MSNPLTPSDFYDPACEAINSLEPFPAGGPTHRYLTADGQGVARAILDSHLPGHGIVVVNRNSPLGGTALLVDRYDLPVGFDSVLPSYFDGLRGRFPDAVSDLVDTRVLFGHEEWVVVVVIHPDGRAEYGPVHLRELGRRES